MGQYLQHTESIEHPVDWQVEWPWANVPPRVFGLRKPDSQSLKYLAVDERQSLMAIRSFRVGIGRGFLLISRAILENICTLCGVIAPGCRSFYGFGFQASSQFYFVIKSTESLLLKLATIGQQYLLIIVSSLRLLSLKSLIGY
jgi:hypothetical protein